jgi:uncharacterized protein YggE
MPKSIFFLCIVFAAAAFAQVDSNSITVTASRNATLQPDQAMFSVSVQSDTSTSLDDVLSALQGSGVTAANLSGVSTNTSFTFVGTPTGTVIVWTFSLQSPLTKTKDTIAMLTTLQQNISQKNQSLKLSFSIQGTQVSTQQQQSQTCSISDLLADARSQAQKLADAGGLSLNAILAISGSTSAAAPLPCSITVKYSVTRLY